MTEEQARAAFVHALTDWRRNLAAVTIAALGFLAAWVIDTPSAYYAAWLVAFSVYMAWFVLAAVEWIRLAEF